MTALTVTTKRLATHLRTAGPADGEPVIFLLKGTSMFSGYFEDPRASAQAVDAAGWFHTGDLAYGDGDYFIVDRKKDMVVSGGENVYPPRSSGRSRAPGGADVRGGRRGRAADLLPGQGAQAAAARAVTAPERPI